MVCPNCHSDQIIEVQDQHFCISCGQMVPEETVRKEREKSLKITVQNNGLPEGVKILPIGDTPQNANLPTDTDGEEPSQQVVLKKRSRITAAAATTEPTTKRRKPGRPKAGRLDVPKSIAHTAPAKPKTGATEPVVATAPIASPRRMSDIARPHPKRTHQPEYPVHTTHKSHKTADEHVQTEQTQTANIQPRGFDIAKPQPAPKKPVPASQKLHKVGLPPLHYGPVLAFTLRAQFRRRHLLLSGLSATSFAAAIAYGAWLVLNDGGLEHLAAEIIGHGRLVLTEALALGAIYYIGRSIGQTAIMYGIARETDSRPVPLSRQIGIGVNTFGRRLALDSAFGALELAVLSGIAALVAFGGASWPVNQQIQTAVIFCCFLGLLYLLTALALSRGLAGVALTLTTGKIGQAAKFGWQLFSHRFELLALRFLTLALELLLALPLAALAVTFIVAAPPNLYVPVISGVGILAWLIGAMLGAGTAAWWVALYRKLIKADHPQDSEALFSNIQPQEANRAPLVVITALTSLLIGLALVMPWIKLP